MANSVFAWLGGLFTDDGTTIQTPRRFASGGATTVGAYGVPNLVANARTVGATAAVASVAAYTPTADGSFRVTGNILITIATSFAFALQVTYTDEGGTARTVSLPITTAAGALSPATSSAIVNANGAVAYMGLPILIRAKANTAITVLTTGTFTTVTYNVEGLIERIS